MAFQNSSARDSTAVLETHAHARTHTHTHTHTDTDADTDVDADTDSGTDTDTDTHPKSHRHINTRIHFSFVVSSTKEQCQEHIQLLRGVWGPGHEMKG
jgi:hypothetical protein